LGKLFESDEAEPGTNAPSRCITPRLERQMAAAAHKVKENGAPGLDKGSPV